MLSTDLPNGVRRHLLEHCKRLGCTCEPEIAGERDGNALTVLIGHDDDCPANGIFIVERD